ncbi:hypothetical protein CMUS01_02418 [Colletotrichum musicola]|uniref:Uncharacterized protein n=1 Tax=Colletotrichum musicola TaxID=2175873 RepID=A0A8H6NVA9_9PEZI|nr:hypothetical protein CMUS01_02418 [Colletotrichum musicola]
MAAQTLVHLSNKPSSHALFAAREGVATRGSRSRPLPLPAEDVSSFPLRTLGPSPRPRGQDENGSRKKAVGGLTRVSLATRPDPRGGTERGTVVPIPSEPDQVRPR